MALVNAILIELRIILPELKMRQTYGYAGFWKNALEFWKMTRIDDDLMSEVNKISTEIYGAIDRLKNEIEQINGKLQLLEITINDKDDRLRSSKYWVMFSYMRCLEKLLHLITSEMKSDLSLMAATRQVFEINIWLWLIFSDERYGLIFYRRYLDDQISFGNATLQKYRDEIKLFEDAERQLDTGWDAIIRDAVTIGGKRHIENALRRKKDIDEVIDDKIRRKFCLLGKSAKYNGYAYQVYLTNKKIIPQQSKNIGEFTAELKLVDQFIDTNFSEKIGNISKGKWNWYTCAEKADMQREYKFIYSYTSKLLHSTPMSIMTSLTLDNSERIVFLEYVYVSILDALDLAEAIDVMPNLFVITVDEAELGADSSQRS